MEIFMKIHGIIAFFCIITSSLVILRVNASETEVATTQSAKPVKLTLLNDKQTVSPQAASVAILFENVSSDKVRILHELSYTNVFFRFKLVGANGIPIRSVLGGKADMDGELNYVTLSPHEIFGLRIALADIFPSLSKGDYQLTVTYQNQYGTNCLQGDVVSNTVHIVIE
jgi:hypothetical protein